MQRRPALALLGTLLMLAATTPTAPAAPRGAQGNRASAFAVPACVNDPSAKATLYGHVPDPSAATSLPATVRIFQDSPAVEAYLEIVTNALAGRSVTPSPSELDDPGGIAKRMARMSEIPNVIATAKLTSLRPDGNFVCRGFGSGRYVVLVDVHGPGTMTTPSAGKIKIDVETYYRGSAEVGDVRRPVAVAMTMEMIGRNPP